MSEQMVTMYMAQIPWDKTYPQPALIPPQVTTGNSVIVTVTHAAEDDLCELLVALEACPPPHTEAGMRLAVTAANLKERQRARLEQG